MPRDFFDPTRAQHNVVLIDAVTLREAERPIQSCEHCHPEDADIPFDWILDRVTGSDPSVTDYVLEEPAKCPSSRAAADSLLDKIHPVNNLCFQRSNLGGISCG